MQQKQKKGLEIMGYIFDHSTGKTLFTLDDNTAIDESGNIVTRVSSNMAVDFSTGKAHFFSDWDSEDSSSGDYDF